MTPTGRVTRVLRAVGVPGAVLGAVLAVAPAASGTAPRAAPTHAEPARAGAPCTQVDRGVVPSTLEIDGVLGRTKVLARGQDRYGVPRPPPLTARGKWQLAWDDDSVRPGDPEGVVRLTAHTYPRGGAGTPALGNLLLARLRPGARLQVAGRGGERLCYRVTRRQQVRADASLSGYYDTVGAPRLAILVCSGRRLGPGRWTHRTVWYAEPVGPAT